MEHENCVVWINNRTNIAIKTELFFYPLFELSPVVVVVVVPTLSHLHHHTETFSTTAAALETKVVLVGGGFSDLNGTDLLRS